jgi:hypothetical protein
MTITAPPHSPLERQHDYDLVGMQDGQLQGILGVRGSIHLVLEQDQAPDPRTEPWPFRFVRFPVDFDLMSQLRQAQTDCRTKGYRSVQLDVWEASRFALDGTAAGLTESWRLHVGAQNAWWTCRDGGELVYESMPIDTGVLLFSMDPSTLSKRRTATHLPNGSYEAWVGDNYLVGQTDDDFLTTVAGKCPEVAAAHTADIMKAKVAESRAGEEEMGQDKVGAPQAAPSAAPRRRMGV